MLLVDMGLSGLNLVVLDGLLTLGKQKLNGLSGAVADHLAAGGAEDRGLRGAAVFSYFCLRQPELEKAIQHLLNCHTGTL